MRDRTLEMPSSLDYSHQVRAVRSYLAALTVFALGCQAVLLGIPLADSVRAGLQGGSSAAAVVCTCARGGHESAACPMHHPRTADSKSEADDSDCRMSSAAPTRSDFVLATGVLSGPPPVLALPIQKRLPIAAVRSDVLTRSSSLDPLGRMN